MVSIIRAEAKGGEPAQVAQEVVEQLLAQVMLFGNARRL